MFKKVISGILSLAMCSSLAVSLKTSNETTNSNNTQNKSKSDYELSGSNSLGNYLTKLSNQNPQEPAVKTETSLFSVTALEFDAETGDVHICSTQTKDCNVTVAIADEFTGEIVKTAVFPVESGEFVVTDEKIDTTFLPEYFVVKAFLSDEIGGKISNEYLFTNYTKDMQEILRADIHDFNEEQVVNFDENEDTNFIVLNEDTVISESTEDENVLVTADYDSNVFSFENADENIRSMEFGQYFYIQPNDTDIIAVAVDSVETDGDITTVKGSDEPIDDMFDFIKIEQTEAGSNMTVDTTDKSDEVTIIGHEDEDVFEIDGDSNIEFTTVKKKYNVEFAYNEKIELKLEEGTVKKILGKEDESSDENDDNENDDKKVDLDGEAGPSFEGVLAFNFEVNFYKKFNHLNIAFTFTPSLTVEVGLEAEGTAAFSPDILPEKIAARIKEAHEKEAKDILKWELELFHISFATEVPGVFVELKPKLEFNASGAVNFNVTISKTMGFQFDNGNGKHYQSINEELQFLDTAIEIEGSISIKLVFGPKLVLINEKIAGVGLEAEMGVVYEISSGNLIERKWNVPHNTAKTVFKYESEEEKEHGCNICATGELKFVLGLSLNISLAGDDHFVDAQLFDISAPLPLFNFHISDHDKVKKGECNYNRYKATFNAVLANTRAPASGFTIDIDGVKVETDSNGKAYVFCDNNSGNNNYNYKVYDGEKPVGGGSFKIQNAATTIDLEIVTQIEDNGNVKYSIPNKAKETKGTIQTNITTSYTTAATKVTTTKLVVEPEYTQIKKGKLGDHIGYSVYGDGTMLIYGYGDMDDKLTSSALNGSYDIDHDGITEKNGFRQVVKEVIFEPYVLYKADPDTGKNIATPISESDIKITSIGNGLFSVCPNLTKIELPSTITVIGDSAFDGCTGIKEANLPSIVSIGHQAFHHCTSLETVNLSDCLEFIDEGAFAGSRITSVIIPESIKVIGTQAFGGVHFGYCKNLKSVTINGDYISDNGEPATYTFSGLESLETVKFGDKVTIINDHDFSNCPKLTEIKLPENLEKIGISAFSSTPLKNVTIPASVKEIGLYAFVWSDKDKDNKKISMSDITFLNPDVIMSEAIGGIITSNANITIHGYAGSTAEKLADKSGSNRNIFVAIDDTATTTTKTTSKTTQTTKATTTTTAKPADILYGDSNGDGQIDMSDAVIIMQMLANPSKFKISPEFEKNADVYQPGTGITTKDALSIQKYLLSLIPELPED